MAEVRARGSAWIEHRPSKPGPLTLKQAMTLRFDMRHARVLFIHERKNRKSFKEMGSFPKRILGGQRWNVCVDGRCAVAFSVSEEG